MLVLGVSLGFIDRYTYRIKLLLYYRASIVVRSPGKFSLVVTLFVTVHFSIHNY